MTVYLAFCTLKENLEIFGDIMQPIFCYNDFLKLIQKACFNLSLTHPWASVQALKNTAKHCNTLSLQIIKNIFPILSCSLITVPIQIFLGFWNPFVNVIFRLLPFMLKEDLTGEINRK